MSAVVLSSVRAEAAWVSCPGTAATSDREFKIDVSGATCLANGTGTGNIDGTSDGINNLGWTTLDKTDNTTTGALQGVLQITSQGTTGTFTINPLAWATYTQVVLAFKSASQSLNPDWATFVLPAGTGSGSWAISGQQELKYANLYASGLKAQTSQRLQPAPVPEPTTLALLATGLGLAAVRKRRAAR